MTPFGAGTLLAAAVAGPPLYTMVQEGALDLTGAAQRGGVVLLGCVVGAHLLARIIDGYARDAALTELTERLLREYGELPVPGEIAGPPPGEGGHGAA